MASAHPRRSLPPTSHTRDSTCDAGTVNPVLSVLRNLPLFSTKPGGAIDFASADAHLLHQTADAADTLARCLHLGTSAVGQLMAHAAPELEDGTVSSDSVEALGWLLSALGELGAQMAMLAVHCGRAAGRKDSTS